MLCDLMRAGLRVLLADMGVEVVAVAQADALRRALRLRANTELLIVDIYQLTEAVEIAREYRLPILVIAPTLADGLAIANDEQFRGVVALPLVQRALADALAAVIMGERFLPLDVFLPLAGAGLSVREQELIALDLHDVPTEAIARWMDVALFTLYTYRNRIRKKLRKLDPAEWPEWVVEWLRRFPGQ
jgi:DNA-binding NarL/FixJ family response regulator